MLDCQKCFHCNRKIEEAEPCFFTDEFDAFICQECGEELMETPDEYLNMEEQFIKADLLVK